MSRRLAYPMLRGLLEKKGQALLDQSNKVKGSRFEATMEF
jgi:hypothetical protein